MKIRITLIIALILIPIVCCSRKKIEPPKVDLHSAVVSGDLEAIRQHIKAGSDLNVLEPSRASTPLITAAYIGNSKAAQLLIDAGADLNYQNADGSTALHTAAVFNRIEVARDLIKAGANLNIQNNDGSTPLHAAAFLCRPEIVKMLLENGADKTLKNKMGKTALQNVEVPFEYVKGAYDAVLAGLRPLGLQLDYEYIKKTRPEIAAMLK